MINTNDIRNNKYRRLAVCKAAGAGKETGRDAASVYCVAIKLRFRQTKNLDFKISCENYLVTFSCETGLN